MSPCLVFFFFIFLGVFVFGYLITYNVTYPRGRDTPVSSFFFLCLLCIDGYTPLPHPMYLSPARRRRLLKCVSRTRLIIKKLIAGYKRVGRGIIFDIDPRSWKTRRLHLHSGFPADTRTENKYTSVFYA